ncbi:MAG TPA: type II toxin-antitoxin system YoeB family toxin [Pseudolabrys sp.]|nr:type II toxin-antitoxin system YoeB family toxin [Pseudolabrys sp.]
MCELLKYRLHGLWSRRIIREDRLVCRVTGRGNAQQVEILQCHYHY